METEKELDTEALIQDLKKVAKALDEVLNRHNIPDGNFLHVFGNSGGYLHGDAIGDDIPNINVVRTAREGKRYSWVTVDGIEVEPFAEL